MSPTQLALWWLTLLALALTPPLFLTLRYRAKPRWLLLGIASYIAAMILKALLYLAAEHTVLPFLSSLANATLTGLISALTELGLLLPFILPALRRGHHVGYPNVLAFGAAIGVFEMLFTLLLGLAQIYDETGSVPTLAFFTDALGWGFLVERGITILGHSASRTLLYAALRHRSPNTALLSLALFTLNEAAAGYPELRGWDWTPTLLALMQCFFAALVIVEFTCIAVLERTPARPRQTSDDTPDPRNPQHPTDPPARTRFAMTS